jgi:glycosyltransferase involved in cell wall biosynthesis
VFNGERYLREALESIFHQSYQPLEVIIVDDGSTDGTAAVAAAYGEKVTYLRQDNAGPAAARNLGLSVAHGEFVAFLDADDVWHQEKLARQMARFQARPELDMCLTHVQNFWAPELQAEATRFHDRRFMQPQPGYTMQALLARRLLFDRIGKLNPELQQGEDTDWFLRATEQGVAMDVLPEVLVYHRLHQANLTRIEASANREWLTHVFKASLDRRRGTTTAPTPLKLPPATRPEKA